MNVLIISDNLVIKENMIRIFSSSNYNYKIISSKECNLNNVIEIQQKFNLIISAHCKKIFPKELVNSIRCINIHPGYNPFNRGYYPQVFSLINNLPIGATIHEMDIHLDHGPIIFQEEVKILPEDTSYSLYNKVVNKEIELFENNFIDIITDNYDVSAPFSEGNLNLKKDFDDLCEINLNDKDTFRNHIQLLKALTFGNYKNAFFLDDDGVKIYIDIVLTKNKANK